MLVFMATLRLDKQVGKLLTQAHYYHWINPLGEYWNCGHSSDYIWLQIDSFNIQFSYEQHVKTKIEMDVSSGHNALHLYIKLKMGAVTWGYDM